MPAMPATVTNWSEANIPATASSGPANSPNTQLATQPSETLAEAPEPARHDALAFFEAMALGGMRRPDLLGGGTANTPNLPNGSLPYSTPL